MFAQTGVFAKSIKLHSICFGLRLRPMSSLPVMTRSVSCENSSMLGHCVSLGSFVGPARPSRCRYVWTACVWESEFSCLSKAQHCSMNRLLTPILPQTFLRPRAEHTLQQLPTMSQDQGWICPTGTACTKLHYYAAISC